MDRNAIKSEFRTSKMSAGGHFVKKNQNFLKIRIESRNVIDGSHFAYRSEMARIAFKSEIRTSKMGAGGHFVKCFEKKVSY